MSEGEFKKRLNQHCFSCVANDESEFSDVEKILDEAKKELALIDDKSYDFVGFVKAIAKWAQKWFGASP